MTRSSKAPSFLLFILCLFLRVVRISSSADTINSNHVLRDGQTLVSSTQIFELGFFSPNTSTNRYLGIWYKNITPRTVIWVANRESPLTNGILTVNSSGQLLIRDETTNRTIWSSKSSRAPSYNPLAQLLDSGNLVIREKPNSNNYLWQSFDFPTDTFVPGMSVGTNRLTGEEKHLTSWKSENDPSPGDFTIGMEITGYPQIIIRNRGVLENRIGPWNGLRFSGMPNVKQNLTMTATLFMNETVAYYSGFAVDGLIFSRFMLSHSGAGQQLTWVSLSREWVVFYKFPADICDSYRLCGAHGNCNNDNYPVCGCLERFVPKDEASWLRSDWSSGCVRRSELNCRDDVFLRYSGIKLPDSRYTWFNESLSLKECKEVCLRNCNCTAYTNLDIQSGRGCLIWFGDLVDVRDLPEEQQVIYIRMAASELGSKGMRRILIAIFTSLGGLLLLGKSLAFFIWKRKKSNEEQRKEDEVEDKTEDLELPIYDLSTVTIATNGFSEGNKLGEGGFGPVYKGMLEGGKEIAVKRLSETSSQGLDQFKNEVICIAKLQHRNLVKLLGCCLEENEKMLIYEYMPNKSLDIILFDKTKGQQLDWPKRFHIINGIARGLLYLHQDSRLRIIHRDLKASNVLLDNDLNPKISDFGMAKIFGGNETEANTRRVVGTYGYMSPEYAVDGMFSLKSDVYSFGVLVLEIVSGQKNRGFHHKDHHHNLVGHAWLLYKEGRSLELVDRNIANSIYLYELLRSIHVALLCVQQRPDDRPSMSSVVLMLGSGGVLPEAKQPGFFTERHGFGSETSTSTNATRSSNECTITLLEAR
ncbi:S-locus lectin protein kinase family protein [Striga asiatica]|uniref:Receptor-like serine/threonine-protein kinase n=1 Tax=Striga asiatica TaxID=4170 RepID=A0A5A7R6G3_STRAF|nr:S-locus lectin protein kinase family protein [Striga asiatica]